MLQVNSLEKYYHNRSGAIVAGIRDINFELKAGEFFTLLGPSGCGKTTTLRCVAGLEEPHAGSITIGDRSVFDKSRNQNIPLQNREIGMVFQSYAVWPHMSVYENAAYPLRFNRSRYKTAKEIEKRVMEVLDAVGLAQLAQRPAPMLSGGQQQRLALARALTPEPKLLLLDEPLSNLDATLRDQMRREIRRTQKETNVTALYVTHDQSEALGMSDRIAVMNDGKIEQIADPFNLYNNPGSPFVLEFIGLNNRLECEILSKETSDYVTVKSEIGQFSGRSFLKMDTGTRNSMAIRPESIVLNAITEASEGMQTNCSIGELREKSFMGEFTEYHILINNNNIISRGEYKNFCIGDKVSVSIKPEYISIY